MFSWIHGNSPGPLCVRIQQVSFWHTLYKLFISVRKTINIRSTKTIWTLILTSPGFGCLCCCKLGLCCYKVWCVKIQKLWEILLRALLPWPAKSIQAEALTLNHAWAILLIWTDLIQIQHCQTGRPDCSHWACSALCSGVCPSSASTTPLLTLLSPLAPACGAVIAQCSLTKSSLVSLGTSHVSTSQDALFLFSKPCLVLVVIMTWSDNPTFINQ